MVGSVKSFVAVLAAVIWCPKRLRRRCWRDVRSVRLGKVRSVGVRVLLKKSRYRLGAWVDAPETPIVLGMICVFVTSYFINPTSNSQDLVGKNNFLMPSNIY